MAYETNSFMGSPTGPPGPGCYGGIWCQADWENCPWTQQCGIADQEKFWGDPSFRSGFTRHLGGINLGFADGHAAWINSEKLISNVKRIECTDGVQVWKDGPNDYTYDGFPCPTKILVHCPDW